MAGRTIHAETHVLGSLRGYGTVAASGGVAADETRELESFQFGEASTAERIARLETHAVMTGRALRSGRFAVSRMMPAGFDDAGRPTVEVITLLFEARDLSLLAGALPRLASDAEFWRTARATVGEGVRVDAEEADAAAAARDARVLRLFDLWRAALRDGAVGVVPEGESDSVLALVAALDPSDRARLRFGIGLLSLSAPVDLCSMASGTSLHGARPALRAAAEGAWHCGSESEYAAFRVSAGGAHLPSIAEIESQGRTLVVRDDDDERRVRTRRDGAAPYSEGGDARARRLMPLAIGSAALSTVVLAFALTMWSRRENAAEVEVPVFAPSSDTGAAPSDAGGDPLSGELPKVVEVVEASNGAAAGAKSDAESESKKQVAPPTGASASGGHQADNQGRAGPEANSTSEIAEGGSSAPAETPPPSQDRDASGGDLSGADGESIGGGHDAAIAPVAPVEPGGSVLGDANRSTLVHATGVLMKLAPLRWTPAIDSIPSLRDKEPQISRHQAEQYAHEVGRAVAGETLKLVVLDQTLKQRAKSEWTSSARETDAIDYVRSLNGFICEKPANGPGSGGQDDFLLNDSLLIEWQAVLKAIERLRSGVSHEFLRDAWNSGVNEALNAIERSDPFVHEKRAFGKVLLLENRKEFDSEVSRVGVVLKNLRPESAAGKAVGTDTP
jgi:hypothetical protein